MLLLIRIVSDRELIFLAPAKNRDGDESHRGRERSRREGKSDALSGLGGDLQYDRSCL
ncbi:MAG: hypothetical protein J7647_15370 [Cyanobacteria bacterium SBLK]|nr:hypothetical protein [Cyanobacteria bacterium SBLK]